MLFSRALLLVPADFGTVVLHISLDPARAAGAGLALPERRASLEIIHEEPRGIEGGVAMLRRRHHQHDIVAGLERAGAMHDEARLQGPACARFRLDALKLAPGHARGMVESHFPSRRLLG